VFGALIFYRIPGEKKAETAFLCLNGRSFSGDLLGILESDAMLRIFMVIYWMHSCRRMLFSVAFVVVVIGYLIDLLLLKSAVIVSLLLSCPPGSFWRVCGHCTAVIT
jgi:hypothetical protein